MSELWQPGFPGRGLRLGWRDFPGITMLRDDRKDELALEWQLDGPILLMSDRPTRLSYPPLLLPATFIFSLSQSHI